MGTFGWLVVIVGIVFYVIWIKIIRPRQSKRLLKESGYHSDNLKGFIDKHILEKQLSNENAQVLASLLFKSVLSNFIWDYHRKKNSKGLSVLFDLQKDPIRQAVIISKIKLFVQDECIDNKMYSFNLDKIMNNARIKCNQLVAPSASTYGI